MNNKPVAWMCQDNVTDEWEFSSMKHCHKCEPLYTHPADLTDEEIANTWDDVRKDATLKSSMKDIQDFARAILRKAQEK